MALRITTALVGLPILIGAIWLGSPWLTVLVSAAAIAALIEFHRLAPPSGSRVVVPLSILWGILLVTSGQTTDRWPDYIPHALLGTGIAASLPWLVLHRNKEVALKSWAYTVAGLTYVGFLLAHAPMLRELDGATGSGRDWLLFAVLATFATDTGAFLTGKAIGRHLMTPRLSPKKTWEGAIGGFLCTIGVAIALDTVLALSVPIWQLALLGSVIGISAQMGDLLESAIKRAWDVKDAGVLLPGHGGILDRIDSIVFTVPLVYYLVALAL